MATSAEIEEGIKSIIWQHSMENPPSKSDDRSSQNRKNRNSTAQQRQRNVERPTPDSWQQSTTSGSNSQNKYWQMRHNRKPGQDRQPYQNKNRPKPRAPLNEQGEDSEGKLGLRDQRRRPRKQKSRTEEGTDMVETNQGNTSPKKRERPKSVRKKSDGVDGQTDESNARPGSLKKKKKKKKKRQGKEDEQKGTNEVPLSLEMPNHPIDGQDLLNPELSPPGEVRKELESEYIHPLKKRSLKFPSAKFFCRLCEYHCDTVTVCRKHMKDTRHQRLRMIKTTDILLRSLPSPSESHIVALDKLTEDVYVQNALSEKELTQRQEVAKHVAELIKEKLPEANADLQVYGSTATEFALKDSDLNMDLTAPDSAKVLANLHLCLADDQSGYFNNVKSDFGAKVPSVLFRMSEYSLKCQVGVNSGPASQTTQLLQLYASLDTRVKKLAVVFRYWARLCQVDCQDAGTLPPYAFAIMTVYYLQQCEPPVLPVLDELASPDAKVSDKSYFDNMGNLGKAWTCENDWTLGRLWVGLLQFYAIQLDISSMVICIRQKRPLTRSEKKWASKKLAIEDPFARKRNIARSVSHSHVFEYIYDRFRAAYLYYGVPQTKNGTLLENVDTHKLERKLQEILKKNNESPTSPVRSLPGSRKESIKTEKKETAKIVIPDTSKSKKLEDQKGERCEPESISTEKDICVVDKDKDQEEEDCVAKTDELLITDEKDTQVDKQPEEEVTAAQEEPEEEKEEDGVAEKEEGPENVGEERETTEFASSLAQDVLCGALAELSLGVQIGDSQTCSKGKIIECGLELSDSDNELVAGLSSEDNEVDIEEADSSSVKKDYEDLDAEVVDLESDKGEEEEEELSEDSDLFEDAKEDVDEETKDEREDETQTDLTEDTSKSMESSGLYDSELLENIPIEDLVFKFDKETLSDGKGPAIMCSICQQEGHLKQNCPEERLPELEPLPPLTKAYKNILDQIILKVPRDFEPRDAEVKMRNEVLKEIENYVRQTYPKAHLTLFGSSCNGFGFGNSDLDICMTVENETSDSLNCVEIIETLASKLKRHRGLYNVLAITTAKVPIVKFRHRRTQLEGDISLYNTLAQHNTRMLQLYSEADYRVKSLGYTLKVFGKLCNICDASRGSLSSYAYIIMVLYFLQQRKPPVIPVLQEVYKDKKPELLVEGWNAWYYDDLKNLARDWEGFGKNKESVGELWLGLLRFYTEEFNFRDYVISVRQQKPLTRFEKLWNGKCIAIEDPFDTSHNLGAGVSRKMNMYIMKALRSGRKTFGTPLDKTPPGYSSLSDYLFDPKLLTEGEPPNDRGCRVCGKIGHFAKECPIVIARKERNERERERRKEDIDSKDDTNRNLSQRHDPLDCHDYGNDSREDGRGNYRGEYSNDHHSDYRNDYRNDHRRLRDQDNRHNQNKDIQPLMSAVPLRVPFKDVPFAGSNSESSHSNSRSYQDIPPLMSAVPIRAPFMDVGCISEFSHSNSRSYTGSSPRSIPQVQRQYSGGGGSGSLQHGVSSHADMSPHSPYSGHAYPSPNFSSSPRMNQGGPPVSSHQVYYNSRLREQQGHQGAPVLVGGNRHQQDYLSDNQESFTWQQKQFLGSSPGRHHSTAAAPGQAQPYSYNNPNKGPQFGSGGGAGGGGGGPPKYQSPQPFQQEWTEHWVMQQQQQMQQQFSAQQQQQFQQQQQPPRPRQPHQFQPQQLAWHQQQQAQQLGQAGGSGGGRWQQQQQQQQQYPQGGGGGGGGNQWDNQGPPTNVFGDHRVVTSANNRSLEVRVPNEHYQSRFSDSQEDYHRGPQQRGSPSTPGSGATGQGQGQRRSAAPATQRLFSR